MNEMEEKEHPKEVNLCLDFISLLSPFPHSIVNCNVVNLHFTASPLSL